MADKTKTARGQMRLARAMAGLPMPDEPPPVTAASFASPTSSFAPFTGLRNAPAPLPAFEQPGTQAASMMPWRGLPAPQMPPVTVTAAPPQPTAPPPVSSGGQGFAGVEPPPASMPAPYDPNLDPRFLPEHWKGAFNWQGS